MKTFAETFNAVKEEDPEKLNELAATRIMGYERIYSFIKPCLNVFHSFKNEEGHEFAGWADKNINLDKLGYEQEILDEWNWKPLACLDDIRLLENKLKEDRGRFKDYGTLLLEAVGIALDQSEECGGNYLIWCDDVGVVGTIANLPPDIKLCALMQASGITEKDLQEILTSTPSAH